MRKIPNFLRVSLPSLIQLLLWFGFDWKKELSIRIFHYLM